MTWKTYADAMLLFNLLGLVVVYGLQRMQDFLPLNPQKLCQRHARLGVQHGRQLCHEYQLAELRRRSDAELPDADARR